MKVSLIILTFNKDHLLKITLDALKKQTIFDDMEIIIINDGHACDTENLAKTVEAKYVFTGHRHGTELVWRCPIVPLNHAIKYQASCDNIIISAAEMLVLENNCIELMLKEFDYKHLVITDGRDDDQNKFLTNKNYEELTQLNTELPFFMGLKKQLFIDLGGYDLDFVVGRAWEDTNFIQRCLNYGCIYKKIQARVVHLFHPRNYRSREKLTYNKNLYDKKLRQIYANQGKDWGHL